MVRRWVWLLAVVLCVPLSIGQGVPASGTVDIHSEPGFIAALLYNGTNSASDRGDGSSAPSCGTGTVTSSAAALRFVDEQTGTGCAEALLPIEAPGGAEHATITFTADRDIQTATTGVPAVYVEMLQEFRIYRDGELVFQLPLFDAADRDSSPPKEFAIDATFPPGSDHEIAWFFEDRGFTPTPTLPSTGTGEALHSTISDLHIRYADVPVPVASGAGSVQVDNGIRSEVRYANVTVAPEWLSPEPGDLRVTGQGRFVEWTVDGEPGPTVPVTQEGDSSHVTVTSQMLSSSGPGLYSFVFETQTPIPATTWPPMFAIAAAIPLVAGAFAGASTYRLHREAHGPYVRTVRLTSIVIGLLVAYHLVLAMTSWRAAGLDRLTRLPPSLEQILVYSQMAAITLMLVAIAIVIAGSTTRSLRRDIQAHAERQRELERMNRDLEQFAYVASHDLQEPLRKVSSFSSMLRKRYQGQLDEKADVYIEQTVDGAKRMQRLVQDLLHYSRVGREGVRLQDVDLNKTMDEVIADLSARIRDTGAVVSAGSLPTITADAPLMRQLLNNLVNNGIKYQAPDARPCIDVRDASDEDAWRIEVEDNGIGIAPEHLERIFTIFQRLHRRDEYEGTGIGLAICQRIAESHDGHIEVRSEPGAGSTFTIIIPRKA